MRIALDSDLCQAYGNCLLAAPEVFHLDASMAVVEVVEPHPPEDAYDAVDEAVRTCPVEALALVDD